MLMKRGKNKKVGNKFFRQKKAQFYLVAAIIIVMILVGIASIQTYAIAKPKPRKIKDISAELNEETSRIIDYGIYNPNFNDSLLVQRVYPDKVMQDKIMEGLKLGEIIIKDIEKNL